MGKCSMAPAAALVTVGVMWVARWRGRTTPVTPAHSAERSSAPEVARVGDTVEGDEERHQIALGHDQVVEVVLGQRGRSRDHALG